jgi:hypothetical protein
MLNLSDVASEKADAQCEHCVATIAHAGARQDRRRTVKNYTLEIIG